MNITDSDPAAQRLQPITAEFQPLDDRILVRRLDEPHNGSIVLPESAVMLSKRGEVVRCGPGKRNEYGERRALAVNPGDVIMFGRYPDFADGQLVIIREGDIVGIVT